MKLYSYFRSSTSYRVRIALNLKGADYEQISVDLKNKKHLESEFGKINAFRTLPVLFAGDQRMVQSLAIIDWLEEFSPEPSFSPSTEPDRQVCRELYYAIATEIHAPNNLSVLDFLRTEYQFDEAAIKKWCAKWIWRTFRPIETRLECHQWQSEDLPFGKPSLFEIALVPQIYNAKRWEVDLSGFPLLLKIDEFCSRISAFQNAHPQNQMDSFGGPS